LSAAQKVDGKIQTNDWLLAEAAINIDPEEVPRGLATHRIEPITPASRKEFV